VFSLPDGRIAISAHGFMPEETIKKHEQTDKRDYRAWAADGWMTMTGGEVTDYREITTYIQDMEISRGWKIHEVCFDPYNATHWANELQEEGYTCIEVRQGMKTLSEPTKQFRDLVATGQLVHDGSPLFKWCVANAQQKADVNENIMLSKKNANDSKRIDLLSAAIDALTRVQSLKDTVSVYETRGIRTL
jgi:phage terminase large subunit-like protein